MAKARSARGEMVDFGLLQIKAQEAANAAARADAKNSATPAIDVKPAEDFVDKRVKRRLKKAVANQQTVQVEAVDVAPKMTDSE